MSESKLISVGLGRCEDKDVVILSYLVDDDKKVYANIIDIDVSTKRSVSAETVRPLYFVGTDIVY